MDVIEAAAALSQNRPVQTEASREANRAWWESALARYTRQRREQLGLSIPAAAELSGLEISEWAALEQGWVPEEMSTVRSIAAAIEVRWTEYDVLAFISRSHQECR